MKSDRKVAIARLRKMMQEGLGFPASFEKATRDEMHHDSRRSVTAREANQHFSKMLAAVEAGEEIVVTKRGRPVAILVPVTARELSPERKAAIERAIALTRKGLPWPKKFKMPTRDEMHER